MEGPMPATLAAARPTAAPTTHRAGRARPPVYLPLTPAGKRARKRCGAAETPAQALARRVEGVNENLIRAIRHYPERLWSESQGRPDTVPAAEALHIARGYPSLARFIDAVASGRALPPLLDDPVADEPPS